MSKINKVCINKSGGIIVLILLLIGVLTLIVSQLSLQSTTTNTRAEEPINQMTNVMGCKIYDTRKTCETGCKKYNGKQFQCTGTANLYCCPNEPDYSAQTTIEEIVDDYGSFLTFVPTGKKTIEFPEVIDSTSKTSEGIIIDLKDINLYGHTVMEIISKDSEGMNNSDIVEDQNIFHQLFFGQVSNLAGNKTFDIHQQSLDKDFLQYANYNIQNVRINGTKVTLRTEYLTGNSIIVNFYNRLNEVYQGLDPLDESNCFNRYAHGYVFSDEEIRNCNSSK